MRTRYGATRRGYNDLIDFGSALAMVAGLAASFGLILWFLMAVVGPWFGSIDCGNARREITFAERCIASPDCTLTLRETKTLKAMHRLELRSCED